MAEENFEKYEELINLAIESIDEKYALTKSQFEQDKDFSQQMMKLCEENNRIDDEVMRRMYERHRDDGNMFPIIFGYATGMVTGINLLAMLPQTGPTSLLTQVVKLSMPNCAAKFEKLIKSEIDKELDEI